MSEPIFTNEDGEAVATEAEARGRPCRFRLKHPERLLHLDETGCNTNQKNDGQRGGKRFIAERGMKCVIAGANANIRFTALPISDSNGKPAMCVLICQSESNETPRNWFAGVDEMADICQTDDPEEHIQKNAGPGKPPPSGPRCHVNDIEIPCFVSSSLHGGITSQMLADVFKFLDEKEVFPRGNGLPNPTLLLDWHGSRFDVPFLDCTLDDDHRWHAFIGVPFGTGLWQAGDAEQCNGGFEVALAPAKQGLMLFWQQHRRDIKFKSADVIPLLNKAWGKSFGDETMVKKALAQRGWNCALLCDKEVLKTVDKEDRETTPLQLSVNDGAAAAVIDELRF